MGITVRGISGMVANIHSVNADVQREVRAAMQREGRTLQADTRDAAPKRTGFLAAHTKLEFSPEGLTYQVGYDEADWEANGMYPYFYPAILGSSTQSPNNFLFNTYETHRASVTRAVGDAVRKATGKVQA